MRINRLELPTVFSNQAKFASDAAHVGVHSARSYGALRAPYRFVDIAAREQTPQVAQEQNCEVKILIAKFNERSISRDCTGCIVHVKAIYLECFRLLMP